MKQPKSDKNRDMNQLKLPLGPPEMDCPLWESCTAPLCPLSLNLAEAVWFPGEPLCRSETYKDLPWLKTQKEIARLRRRHDRGYFTLEILKSTQEVKANLKGIKDESPESSEEGVNGDS